VTKAYEHFDFHEVFHSIHNFCVVDMSSIYLDILKDKLYTAKADSVGRRASQWALSDILSVLTRLMAPILSFTAAEVWGYVKQGAAEPLVESVFFAPFPEVRVEFLDAALEEKWKGLLELRDEVNKALEIKRAEKFIGNSLEAKVRLYLPERLHSLVESYRGVLPAIFLVSSTEMSHERLEGAYESTNVEGLQIAIERAPGNKCGRCWNWSERVGTFSDEPELCERCYPVIKKTA
jgi:isoleucyl-tRNA synthetase